MKLYDHPGTPNAARIRIVIAEKGLEGRIEYVWTNLVAAEQKSPEFLAMNPVGKTPVLLLEDGLALSESPAITEYLDTLDGNPVLTGRSPRERAVIQMMQRRVEILLLDPIDDYFHYGTPGLGETLRPWRMPDWSEGKQEWGQRRGTQALANLPYFESVLAERPFLAGDSWSVADITLFAAYTFANPIGLTFEPEFTAIHAWFARFSELPAVKNRSGQDFPTAV